MTLNNSNEKVNQNSVNIMHQLHQILAMLMMVKIEHSTSGETNSTRK